MALYLANGIEEGRLDYLAVFKIQKYLPLKDTVDSILVADGFQDKIVPIV